MNYYEILGIKKTATDDEIKNAYKKLVKKYHPDIYKGDKKFAENKMQEINNAYDTLSDADLKKEYDDEITPSYNVTHSTSYTSSNTNTYSNAYSSKNRSASTQNANYYGGKYTRSNK